MATINGSTNTSVWSFKLDVIESSTDQANNTSKLDVIAYLGRPNSDSYMHGAKLTVTVNVTGCSAQTITYNNPNRIDVETGTSLILGRTTFSAVPHDADGSKTVTVSASFTNNVSPKSGSASGSVKLTTIPRASQPSCVTWPEHTQNVGNFGDTISIHMNRKSDSFTHTVRYAFGSLTGTIANNVTTGTTWTIPLSFMDLIPTTTSGSGTIYVDTYNGSTFVGTKYCGFTATVPSSVKPSASLQVLDATATKDKYGNLVKGLSKLYIKITGTPAYSSAITDYMTTVFYTGTGKEENYQEAKNELTTGVIPYAGEVQVHANVADQRGRTSATASASFPVLDYTSPAITALSVHRCLEDGTESDQGEHIKVTFSAAVTPLNNKNSATYKLSYKKTTDESFTNKGLGTLAGQYDVTDFSYIFAADSDSSYDVTVTVTDDLGPVTRSTSASTGFTFMDWNDDGKSIAFGKVSEESGKMEIALHTKQIGNSFSFQPSAFNGAKGYTLLAVITLTTSNVNAPIVFTINRRGALCPMQVYVRFASSSETTDPALDTITYEGDNYGAFLVKAAESTWRLYVDNTSGWSNPCLQSWYTTDNQMSRLSIVFPSEQVEELPTPYYRATPAKMQSLLDYIYPVGSIYFSYSHVSPSELFGGTWVRIENAFLWAVDEKGVIGQTGGEKTHTLTVSELPSHSHGSVYSQHASGTKDKAWYNTSGSSVAYGTVATGGGAAHNNMPPYIQVSVWRRTA